MQHLSLRICVCVCVCVFVCLCLLVCIRSREFFDRTAVESIKICPTNRTAWALSDFLRLFYRFLFSSSVSVYSHETKFIRVSKHCLSVDCSPTHPSHTPPHSSRPPCPELSIVHGYRVSPLCLYRMPRLPSFSFKDGPTVFILYSIL